MGLNESEFGDDGIREPSERESLRIISEELIKIRKLLDEQKTVERLKKRIEECNEFARKGLLDGFHEDLRRELQKILEGKE